MTARRRAPSLTVVVLVGASLVAVASPAAAATIAVTTTADVVDAGDGQTSLREAVSAANADAAEDVIELGNGATYALTICDGAGEEDVNASGDLDHTVAAGRLVVNGHGSTISQTCGLDSGDRVLDSRSLTGLGLFDVTIEGGDVAAAGLRGGGVEARGPSVLSGVVFRENRAAIGGGFSLFRLADVQTLSIVAGSFEDNEAVAAGGGLSFDADASASSVSIAGTSFVGNEVTAASTLFGSGGGGAFLRAGDIEVTGVDASGNTVAQAVLGAGKGGGFAADVSPDGVGAAISDSTFEGNTAAGAGGGLYLQQSNASCALALVEHSTIRDNIGGEGGGIVAECLGLSSSTVDGNDAGAGGGGIDLFTTAADSSILQVSQSTIAGNTGTTGGIEATAPSSELLVESSTVTDNGGTVGGIASGGELTLVGLTLAGSSGTEVDELEATGAGSIVSSILGDDRLGSPSCALGVGIVRANSVDVDTSCLDDAAGNVVGHTPRLGPLADNGGPTETRLPDMASPALDLVPPAACGGGALDQRGIMRPQGVSCDAGAVERELPAGAPRFSDVPAGHPFFWEIECLVERSAAVGYSDGTFRPGAAVSRQAVVAWLWHLVGAPAPSGAPPFSDVSPIHPFADAIAWAAEEDVVTGFADGTFRPATPVSRQALSAWLWRVAGEPVPHDDPPFTDVSGGHPFADAIAWLAESEVAEGFPDGTFRPTSSITRQAVAAWVCRADDVL
jgi:hypothetical protein